MNIFFSVPGSRMSCKAGGGLDISSICHNIGDK
jgi:hypothetical protein